MFRDRPIRQKLMMVLLLTSLAVLVLACTLFIAFELATSRKRIVQTFSVTAEMIATQSSAALAFQNPDDAIEVLAALKAEPQVVAARLYDQDGHLFARYPVNATPEAAPSGLGETAVYRFESGHLFGVLPVAKGNKRLGTLQLQLDLKAMRQRFWSYGTIALVVMMVSLIAAFLISAVLQRHITNPILSLAATAHIVSEQKDYSARARKFENDEVGRLTDAFNQMLGQIQTQHANLQQRQEQLSGALLSSRSAEEEIRRLNTELEQRVQERTAALARANTELAHASKHKDEFLANMSHELRTPLNSILGLSETLLEQISGSLTDRQIKSVTTIAKSGQHLLSLINDILDLSKIEAGKLELHVEPLHVDEFCQSCLAFVRTQAMEKKISVAFEPDGRVDHLSADPKRLKQILVNLLTNAVKFTPEGGRMGLTVTAPENEEVARFVVWDSGIGIAAADQGKLFRSFTQIDSGLTRAQEGTGLGLALVAKLVELHGGSVALESEPGKGSRFIVTLPRDVSVKSLPQESTANSEPDRRGYRRALIIEDDPTSGAILVNYLTELGLESVLHVQGEKSLETVLRERPDVILLDILLPNDSGWVVLTRLQEHPVARHIPVVVVSVVDEPEKSLALGAAAHFTKPVSREQLAGFLQRVVVSRLLPAPPCVALLPSTGPTILLAEDNEANIETIGGYLGDKGYTMHYATNGLVALKLAREVRPALILMDIQMPVLDGLSAIRELRADASFRNIPIVALTALAMVGDRERCLAAGATDYMSKPVKLKALSAVVSRLLAQRAAVGPGT